MTEKKEPLFCQTMQNNNYIEWGLIVRKILEQCTEEEEKLFQSWYSEDEKNREYFEKARSYFDRYYTGNEERVIDRDGAWEEFITHTRKSGNNFNIRKILKYAAVIALPLLGSWAAYTYIAEKKSNTSQVLAQESLLPGAAKAILVLGNGKEILLSQENHTDTVARENNVIINHQKNGLQYNSQGESCDQAVTRNTIITPRGGEYQVTLSDGTKISLNADSKLIFPVEFPQNIRKVQLIGEAYFEVARNEKAPFVVETQAGKIRVLGTTFNVSAYSNDDIIQTTLVTGSVSFTDPKSSSEQIIKPGEQITYNRSDQSIQVQKVNTDVFCSWRNGLFILEAQRLEDIMKRISRWYDVEVFYQSQEAKDLVFTGDLEKYEKCDVILEIIELSTKVQFSIKGRTITVMMQH